MAGRGFTSNVPDPNNPKTALLVRYSALAALRQVIFPVRYGTRRPAL
jgi:predicted dinucleotide-utilizing enzyme